MTNEKEIRELIKARTAELQGVIDAHEKMRQEFLKKGQANQLKVTHLEGCIAQLQDLLPKEKGNKKSK